MFLTPRSDIGSDPCMVPCDRLPILVRDVILFDHLGVAHQFRTGGRRELHRLVEDVFPDEGPPGPDLFRNPVDILDVRVTHCLLYNR